MIVSIPSTTRFRKRVLLTLAATFVTSGVGAAGLDIQAHRGGRGLAPENTLPAFERSIALGVPTLELDVVMTRDGVFAVHHDLAISPKSCLRPDGSKAARRALAETDFSQIASLDCGGGTPRKFPQQVPAPGAGIPRLEQVLDLVETAPYPVRVSIEVKQPVGKMPRPLPDFVAAFVDLLRSRDLAGRIIVQSKRPEVLAELRRQAADLERSLLRRTGRAKRWVDDGTATIVSRKKLFLRRPEVRKLEAKGIPSIPWTVNSPKAMRKLIDWGVAGFITDYPDRALAITGEQVD